MVLSLADSLIASRYQFSGIDPSPGRNHALDSARRPAILRRASRSRRAHATSAELISVGGITANLGPIRDAATTMQGGGRGKGITVE